MRDPDAAVTVIVTKDGPHVVKGDVPLVVATIGTDADGGSTAWLEGDRLVHRDPMSLCRCGHSADKQFCDGSDLDAKFDYGRL